MRIVGNKSLASLLIKSPVFLPPDIEAQTMETGTLLGPYFRLSPLQVRHIMPLACYLSPNVQ